MLLTSRNLLAALTLLCVCQSSDVAWAQRGGRGGGGFSPEQIFDRLDGNGDGRLSPEEMQQSRGFSVADIARQNGIDPDDGISRDDFSRVWAAQFQQREAGGGFGGGAPGGGFGGAPGGGFGGGGFPAPGGEGGGLPPGGPGGAPMGPGGGQWGGGAPGGGGQWGGGGGGGQWGGGGGGQWGGGGGGQWGGGGGGQWGGDEGDDDRDRSSTERPRQRVTFDLPGDYVAGDSDGDNQLGLNEWTSWKSRSAMREFLSLDEDGDGFLTPRELGASGSSASRSSSSAVASGPGGAFASGGGQRDEEEDGDDDQDSQRRGGGDEDDREQGNDQPDSTPAAPAAPAISLEDFEFDASSARARGAANDFGLMDKNDDGKINADEWAASQRIRPQFVTAGIDISGEMEQEEFVKTYLWIQSQRN